MANIRVVINMIHQLLYIMNHKQKRQCIIAFIAMLIAAIFETLGVSVVIPFIISMTQPNILMENQYVIECMELFQISSSTELMLLMAVGVILIYIIKNIIILLSNYTQIRFRNNLENDLSVLMLQSYMKRPYTFFLETNSGEILRGVNSDISGVAQVVDGFFLFFSELLTFSLIGVFLLYLNPFIACGLIIAVIAAGVLSVYGFKRQINRLGIRAREVFAKKYSCANQAIGGIKEITVMQRRECFVKQYEEASRIAGKIIEVVFIASIVLMCTIGLQGEVNIVEYIPQLSAIAVACVRILPSMSTMTSSINTLVYYRMTLDSVCENYRSAEQYENERGINTDSSFGGGNPANGFHNSIFLNDISWRYNNSDVDVLHNLSLTIQKGEAVGFIGESGAGKSTLADIILGLLKPQCGQVKVDNTDIYTIPKQWARIVGYVPQTVFLSDDTVRRNIAFGLPEEEIDDKLIWEALQQAQLSDFVRKLPEGLNTVVGERGIKFSGGQRQRVAIARALYYDPEILVLDEATSALDTETEQAVMEAIDTLQGHKTLIIVAHRLTTIKNCDKIYEIKDGKADERKYVEIMNEMKPT